MGMDRGFLSMLTSTSQVERFVAEDAFGNESYTAAAPFDYAPITGRVSSFGQEDGHNKQDSVEVDEVQIITDASILALRDRVGGSYYVASIDTVLDESGADYCQQVTLSTRKKG